MKRLILYFILSMPVINACDTVNSHDPSRAFTNIEKDLQIRFMLAEDNEVIELASGHFLFSKSLILDGKKNITIKGAGIDETVLSFKGQKDGAEGIRVANCENIVFKDFTIEDAAGDNIKVTDTDGISFHRIGSAWTGIVDEENGAYGLYPVLCKNVLVEECQVIGASDAGIYVGQSENVIIRNNIVYWNVAGIESENSENVDIYGNEAYDNTGGILVFDLPGLTRYGSDIRVYDNKVHKNNLKNFAPKGNIVGTVPPGTGMLILATRKVDIYQNQIKDNKTIGIGIVSYDLVSELYQENRSAEEGQNGSARQVDRHYTQDVDYDPYPGEISIHDNEYENSYVIPDLRNPFGKILLYKFKFNLPYIAWDGITPKGYVLNDGRINPAYHICINEDESIKRAMLDAGNNFKNLTTDPSVFICD